MNIKKSKHLRLNKIKRKKILIVTVLIFSFLMIPIINNIKKNQSNNEFKDKIVEKDDLLKENLKTQDLTTDNTFSGISAPWNVTHYANVTKTNLAVSFTNNTSYDNTKKVELDYGWIGYQLNSTIKNLYDTRNWINGTFHGKEDNGYTKSANDSAQVLNWTFNYYDDTGVNINTFAGNYYDSDNATNNYQDCLEIRVNGDNNDNYDVGDKAWWETTFTMDRGEIDEAVLSFAVFPHSETGDPYQNHMVLQVIVNDQTLWGIGLASMLDACGNPNGQWYKPPSILLDADDPDIFPTDEKDMNITLEFKRVSGSETIDYADSYSVLIDNVSLVVKSQAKPSQLGLYLNGTKINNVTNYGEGYCGMSGNWNGSKIDVYANFSSNLNWLLSFDDDDEGWIKYKIELDADLELYANKSTPESYYIADPDTDYQGSSFIVSNNSKTNWTTYAHMEIPTGYEETNMTLEFPKDYNLTGVFLSQNSYSSDQTPVKAYGNKKVVNIPISSLTSNTNGFWKITTEAPNYCTEMNIYNATGDLVTNNEFFSGDWVNITANIDKSLLISDYIGETKAQLQIKFPNGTIWTEQTKFKQVGSSGIVNFSLFQIPPEGSNYIVGEYQAIVTWNNSHSNFNIINETGIIYKTFTVIHNSTLTALDSYHEDVIYGEEINLEVTFKDLKNDKPIEGASITLTNFTGGIQTFQDLDNGYYLLIFNTSGGDAGENKLTIHASHPSYLDNEVNITIEVIFSTSLTAEESPSIEVPWNNNFTIHLNYTYSNESVNYGVEGAIPIVTWDDDWSYIISGSGLYDITCNTSEYQVNTAPNIRIEFDELGYESQTIIRSIEVVERQTFITEIIIDDNNCTVNKTANIYSGKMANLTVKYVDNDAGGTHIHNATITLNGTNIGEVFTENTNFYNLSLNSTKLGVGIFILNIIAQKDNFTTLTEKLTVNVYTRETDYAVYFNGTIQTEENPTIQLYKNQFLNITFAYNDTILKEHIPGATVDINGSSISENLVDAFNNYSMLIDTNELNQGVNFLTLFARKVNYEAHSILIIIEIIQIQTNLTLFLDGEDSTSNPSIIKYPNQNLNITVMYNNNNTLTHIPGAIVDINGTGISKVLNENFNIYSVNINTNDLSQGVNFLTIYARKDGYEPQTISIVVEIGQIGTSLTIIMNGKDLTNNPVFNLTIGQSINLTVKYTDLNGVFINNATTLLIGEDLSLELVKDNNYDQYYRILDSTELRIGAKLFTIIAQKSNFQSLAKDIRITVNKIAAKIRVASGLAQIEAEVGDNIILQVILNDTIFGTDITNATILYNSPYYQGELIDSNNNGIYEDTIENVREGIHTITINAFAGDNYDFESYTITLVVTTPTTSPGPDLSWLLYVLGAGIIGLVAFFTIYQTYLKYPPMIRKIRKLKKKVKKSKRAKSIFVNKREQIIKNELQNQIKIIEYEPIQDIVGDKIEKIPIKGESGE